MKLLEQHPEIIAFALTIIYEIIVRKRPTKKTWSIIKILSNIVDRAIKDRAARGGTH